MDGEWGDWIALWDLINMLQIPVAIVSSLGETGLKVICPADCQNEAQMPLPGADTGFGEGGLGELSCFTSPPRLI